MKLFLKISAVLTLAVVLVIAACQLIILQYRLGQSYAKLQPFERVDESAEIRILILGDSTGVGTGAESDEQSIAGRLGADFPAAHIENNSKNGRKIADLLDAFTASGQRRYDLVVIQIGGNDILYLTDYAAIRQGIERVVARARMLSDQIVMLHSGNVGGAPLFIRPISDFYTHRTERVRDIYMEVAAAKGVGYIDLFRERSEDLFLLEADKYYAPDHIHPSGPGYGWWYERLRETMRQKGFTLGAEDPQDPS